LVPAPHSGLILAVLYRICSQPPPHPLTPPLPCPLPRAAVCIPLLRRPLPPRALPAQPLSAAGGAAVLLRPSQAAQPTPRNRSRRLVLAGPWSLRALWFLFAQVHLSTPYPRRRCFPPAAIPTLVLPCLLVCCDPLFRHRLSQPCVQDRLPPPHLMHVPGRGVPFFPRPPPPPPAHCGAFPSAPIP
jgi:hypothetical protein